MTERQFRKEIHHGRVVPCYPDRPADLYAMFLDAVRRAPDAVALVEGDMRWTYTFLARRVAACAARLTALGLAAGDRMGILLSNRADYVTLLVAAARLGVIAVPMNIRQRAPETAYLLADSGAAAIIYDDALADQLPDRASLPHVHHWLPYATEAAIWTQETSDTTTDAPDRSAVGEDDPFCILYTSGTTGRPKGAVLTHLGLITICIGSQNHLGLKDGESMILSVPASHVTGVGLVMLLSIRVAGKIVMEQSFKARPFLELAQAERMSFAIMVPSMYKLCLMEPDFGDFDLSSWRIGAFGGAPMAEATIQALAERAPQLTLVNIYGSTETSSPAVMMPLGQCPSHPDKVGKALPYADIVIMDEDGRQLPPGQQGEIWIAGAMTVPRYWNNAEATDKGFAGGYWKSGDIGTMDADGYIRVLDRMKDMINRGGYKVYSVEVENTLMAHDAVAEAVVVGRPCPVLGERVEAFVVTRGQVDQESLRGFCAERLSDYKVPDHVYVVDGPLPRNPNGKLLKSAVREWLPALSENHPM
ncbi:putative fatty-acid--CoA ligase [Sphingobium herbicidovorans NBRC 16415]|uniref:Fatty-acid--CoA ligase n=1 Tax=Sphingobium herbicidovorans (strain ATCC 700291 / DSM 11019 / CCUG 56400 / KCTC 2939 / LMG 18315 / NBRC 16415 / MH) TaxID=1219045 RepID=A0A086P4M5_SPHHM|nr:AMP-binding protein [Sphingobium herbicidovorans]KFG88343.1 putative fatty-acid--CoA ligase [Sphingobium herbicidovorans NBRC 16415]